MITTKLLREWGACWPDDKINECMPKDGVAPRALAADTAISLDDRLWVITKCVWYLDESAARCFAIECALSVAHLAGNEDDQAQFRGLMNDLLAIEDLHESERGAARDAAWDAARGAARGAAWDAARGAAIEGYLASAVSWLGDYADGWEE